MKKLIIAVAFLALGSTTITSCKKEYVCKCNKTYTHSNGTSETKPDGQYTFKDTSPRAADRCNQQEGTGSDVLQGDWTRDCEID